MVTKILWAWELPEKIEGVAVVADVWAATTNLVTFLRKKVEKLIIVNDETIQSALKKYNQALLIGESSKIPKKSFTSSNEPFEIESLDLTGKTVLYLSYNGSKVIEILVKRKVKKIIPVSFSNLSALSDYLTGSNENIYLIPAGDMINNRALQKEDLICMQSLEKLIRRDKFNLDKAYQEAIDFINHFYNEEVDRSRYFETVLGLNSSKLIPFCYQNEQGFSEVMGDRFKK